MKEVLEILKEVVTYGKERLKSNKRLGLVAAGVVLFQIIVLISISAISKMERRISKLEKRVDNLECLYTDLTSNVAKLSEGMSKESVVYILTDDKNFSKTIISIDDIYAKAKAELLENRKNIPEAHTVYLNAVKQSKEKDIPIHVVYTLLSTESSFKYTAKNPVKQEYGRGIMQVSDLVLSEYNNNNNTSYNTYDLENNIAINMEIGCWYYKRLYEHYNKGDTKMTWDDMYVAYNVGYTDYKKNIKSYRKGWDPTRKIKYTALSNWQKNFNYYKNYFYS